MFHHDDGVPSTVIALDKPNLIFVIGIPVVLMLVAIALTAGIYMVIGGRRAG